LLKNIVLKMNSVTKKLMNVSKLTAVDMLCVKQSQKPIQLFSVIVKTVIVSVLPMSAKLKNVEQILTAKKPSVIDTVVGPTSARRFNALITIIVSIMTSARIARTENVAASPIFAKLSLVEKMNIALMTRFVLAKTLLTETLRTNALRLNVGVTKCVNPITRLLCVSITSANL